MAALLLRPHCYLESYSIKDIQILEMDYSEPKTETPMLAKAKLETFGIDFCVMIDCTGSMGSYINMSRNKIKDIIKQVKEQYAESQIRVAIVAYRDIKDANRYKVFHFSEDLDKAKKFLDGLQACGGGDIPEDVNGGFQKVLYELKWQSPIRTLVHVADAPCHGKTFHNCDDDYPNGHKNDKPWNQIFKDLVEERIDYMFLKISSSTDKMFTLFKEMAIKNGAEEFDVSFTQDSVNSSTTGNGKATEEGFAAVISEKIKVSVEKELKKGLKNRLAKRTEENAELVSKIKESVKEMASKIDFNAMREKYKDLAAKVGECILSSNNFIDALADEDCLCLTFNIGRSQAAIADPTQILIKDVYPSFITVGSFFFSTEYALKKNKLAHGGYEKHAEGMIVKGAASENITGVMPLYFCEENWPVAKQLMKLTLGWDVTLEAAGYEYAQMKTVPFLILGKLAQMKHEKPGSEFLNFQFDLVKRTCMKIMEDGSQPSLEKKFNEEVLNLYNNYLEDSSLRTVDSIASNSAFLVQLYIAFELGAASKGEEYFDKLFLELLVEELRRRQHPLSDEVNQNEWVMKLLNVDLEEYVVKPYNEFVAEHQKKLAEEKEAAEKATADKEEVKKDEEEKLPSEDPRIKEIREYKIRFTNVSAEYSKEQKTAFGEYHNALKRVMDYLYPLRMLFTTKKVEKPYLLKEWGFESDEQFFTLYIQNKLQGRNKERREAFSTKIYRDPLTQAHEFIQGWYRKLVEGEKAKRISNYLAAYRPPLEKFIASGETYDTASSLIKSAKSEETADTGVAKELEFKGKPHIKIAFIGHVDCGKSTISGHMLKMLGAIEKEKMKKLEKDASDFGKPSYKYAWAVDKLRAERERGITIDIGTEKFETAKNYFTLISTPGHRDFMKNTLTGISLGDCAVLVVSAEKNEFEAGISKEGQTRDHATLAFTLGVKQMIVCVNKMDAPSVSWSEKRFNQIKEEISIHIKRVGYQLEKVAFVPVSGFNGDNLIEKSTNLSWYTGPTLLEVFEDISPPSRPITKPLRIPLESSYKIAGVGTVGCGVVNTGKLEKGMNVTIAPSNHSSKVDSIEFHYNAVSHAIPGDLVGFVLSGVSHKEIKRGYMVGDSKNTPPKTVKAFTAQIVILNHPKKIKKGYTPVMDCHTAHVACRFKEILKMIDKKTGKEIDSPEFVQSGDVCIVRLEPIKPVCIETFADFPSLGRFSLRDMQQIVGVGIVQSVEHS